MATSASVSPRTSSWRIWWRIASTRFRWFPASVLGYDAMTGSVRFREQLGRFMGRTFLGREFPPHQISVLAGAGSVLEILFHALADPGDGVLVPTPSYAGFWMDLELRDDSRSSRSTARGCRGFRLTPERLDRAVAEAGRPVKVLLFTTPNNPLGTVYSADEIDEILAWAEGRGLHVVFDEIYALVGLRQAGVHQLRRPAEHRWVNTSTSSGRSPRTSAPRGCVAVCSSARIGPSTPRLTHSPIGPAARAHPVPAR